ncbi:MAG TPA: acyl-CoA dehydrogenase family protein [Gammaproteobacteria bacterium]|jgi:acyl-CoA dehydrogenase|nr:acyl-CoA dehydrogenase family protein [Gammaproteobacteria bacterium]
MRNPFDNEERRTFRDAMARFVRNEIEPFADDWDEAGAFPWAVHEKACALGLFGFDIDEVYGGLGFDDAFMRAASAEEFGRGGAGGVAASIASRSILVGPLNLLAAEELKARALPEILSGRAGGALGITEPSGGSDVANLQTRAHRDGDEYVLNGSKTFITGGMNAAYFVIAARTGGEGLGGISLFFVDADIPGFSRTAIERKMGWWASDTATLYFDDCRVPASHLMGEENKGFLAIMNNFNYERLYMSAQMLGMSRRCLDESVRYAGERSTFGKPLIKHQVIRHKIAEMSSRIDAMDALINQICWCVNESEMPVAEISKAKFFCSTALEFCANEAMQIFGGAAYLRGHPVERIYRETKVMAIGGGSAEIMRDLAVRQMGL